MIKTYWHKGLFLKLTGVKVKSPQATCSLQFINSDINLLSAVAVALKKKNFKKLTPEQNSDFANLPKARIISYENINVAKRNEYFHSLLSIATSLLLNKNKQ